MGTISFESFEADISRSTSNKGQLDSDNESDYPGLTYPAAVPNVEWQQCNSVIILKIEAPAIDDYYLRVTDCSLQFRLEKLLMKSTAWIYNTELIFFFTFFSCRIADVPQILYLNLLGCIDAEYTSHELRGFFVYVVLIKTLRDAKSLWPRLTVDTDRHEWLKYTTDAISMIETPKNRILDSDDSIDPDTSDCQLST